MTLDSRMRITPPGTALTVHKPNCPSNPLLEVSPLLPLQMLTNKLAKPPHFRMPPIKVNKHRFLILKKVQIS